MLDILSYKNIFIRTDTSIFILFVIAWSHTIGKMVLSGLNAQNIWSISHWNNSGLCWTPSASRFFSLNRCVSANTDALHFHKLNYIYAQTKYYSCKKCFISHYEWARVILMQHTWDKLAPCGQITSEIFHFALSDFTQSAMLLVPQISPFNNHLWFYFVGIAHLSVFLH